jgi:hypothetical protein
MNLTMDLSSSTVKITTANQNLIQKILGLVLESEHDKSVITQMIVLIESTQPTPGFVMH